MSFDLLKEMLSRWPAAVDKELICDPSSEEQKVDRGNSIITFFLTENLSGKKFLDFGCGEGHAVQAAKNRGAAVATGYDIVTQGGGSWDQDDSQLFTDWSRVKENGPYDVVLAYDVLDHVADPVDMMVKIRSVVNLRSNVFVLTHPWCSRHGGHLYHDFNHAFAHVVFSEDELKEMGVWKDHGVQHIVNPINKYKTWFGTNFNIVRSDVTKSPVEDFFRQSIVRDRIISRFQALNPVFVDFPQFQMEQSFHEYVLKAK